MPLSTLQCLACARDVIMHLPVAPGRRPRDPSSLEAIVSMGALEPGTFGR